MLFVAVSEPHLRGRLTAAGARGRSGSRRSTVSARPFIPGQRGASCAASRSGHNRTKRMAALCRGGTEDVRRRDEAASRWRITSGGFSPGAIRQCFLGPSRETDTARRTQRSDDTGQPRTRLRGSSGASTSAQGVLGIDPRWRQHWGPDRTAVQVPYQLFTELVEARWSTTTVELWLQGPPRERREPTLRRPAATTPEHTWPAGRRVEPSRLTTDRAEQTGPATGRRPRSSGRPHRELEGYRLNQSCAAGATATLASRPPAHGPGPPLYRIASCRTCSPRVYDRLPLEGPRSLSPPTRPDDCPGGGLLRATGGETM